MQRIKIGGEKMNVKDVNCIMIDRVSGLIFLTKMGEYDKEKEEYDETTLATFEVVEDADENLSWSERSAESFHVEFKGVEE